MIIAKGSSWDGTSDGTNLVYADVVGSTITVYTANGAISETRGTILLNKAGVLAATLAAPTAGGIGVGDDGKVLKIISETAYAHTVTVSGLNGASSAVITYANAGDGTTLTAFGGYWWVSQAVTAAFSNQPVATYTTATAITQKTGMVILNGTAAIAMTLAAPTAGTDDGKVLTVIAQTTFAHTLTVAAVFDASHTIATWSLLGQNIVLVAINGAWKLQSYYGVALS